MSDKQDYSLDAREHLRALKEFYCDMTWAVDATATQAEKSLVLAGEGGAGSTRVKLSRALTGGWVCDLTCKHIKETHKGRAHTPALAVQDALLALLKAVQADVAALGLCLVRFQIAEADACAIDKPN